MHLTTSSEIPMPQSDDNSDMNTRLRCFESRATVAMANLSAELVQLRKDMKRLEADSGTRQEGLGEGLGKQLAQIEKQLAGQVSALSTDLASHRLTITQAHEQTHNHLSEISSIAAQHYNQLRLDIDGGHGRLTELSDHLRQHIEALVTTVAAQGTVVTAELAEQHYNQLRLDIDGGHGRLIELSDHLRQHIEALVTTVAAQGTAVTAELAEQQAAVRQALDSVAQLQATMAAHVDEFARQGAANAAASDRLLQKIDDLAAAAKRSADERQRADRDLIDRIERQQRLTLFALMQKPKPALGQQFSRLARRLTESPPVAAMPPDDLQIRIDAVSTAGSLLSKPRILAVAADAIEADAIRARTNAGQWRVVVATADKTFTRVNLAQIDMVALFAPVSLSVLNAGRETPLDSVLGHNGVIAGFSATAEAFTEDERRIHRLMPLLRLRGPGNTHCTVYADLP
jgi:hypothetical protein